MSVTRKWSFLAAVLVVAIVAAGWFLLITPKRSEAAGLRSKAVSQDEANDRLTQQLEVLKAQQADLPKQRALLANIRTQIPDNPALPTLIRDLTSAGRKSGVSLDTLAPATPVAVVLAAPVAPVATVPPADATAGTTEGATDAGAAAAPAVPVVPPAPTLLQVPLTLEVSGSYFELEQFVNKLERLKRSFLITGFTIGESTADSAAEGDLGLSVQGRVFLSPKGAAAAVAVPVAPVAAAPADAVPAS